MSDQPAAQPPVPSAPQSLPPAPPVPPMPPLPQSAPQVPQAPPAIPPLPQAPQAMPPGRPSAGLFASITSRQWFAALRLAGLALAGSGAVSLIIVLLTLIAVTTSGLPDQAMSMISGAWFFAVFQFIGMGFLSPLGARIQAGGELGGLLDAVSPELAQLSGSVSVLVPLALVPVGAIAAVLIFGRRVIGAHTASTRGQRLLLASSAGAAFAAVVVLLQALLPISVQMPGVAPVDLRAISIWGVLLMLAVGAGTAYLVLGAPPRVGGTWWGAAVHTAQHLGAYGLVLGLAASIALVVESGAPAMMLLLLPVLLPIIAFDALTIGLFGVVTSSGSAIAFPGTTPTLGMFSEALPLWLRIVLPIVTLVVLIVAALRWRARSGAAPQGAASWVVLAVTYGVAGLVALAFGTVSMSASVASLMGYSGAFGPAPWAFLLFAIVGLVVEVLARFVAAPIAGALPAAVVTALTWRAGHTPAPVPAPGPGAGYVAGQPGVDPYAAAAAGAPQPAPLPPSRPMSRRAKLAWAWSAGGVAGVALLVVAGTIVHGQLAQSTFGPQAKAEAYLQALVDGDASRAVELWDPNVTSAERVLLSDEVYGAAADRPTAYEIADVTISDDHATVDATMTIDRKSYPVTFALEAVGTQAVLWNDWRITTGPLQYLAIGDVSGVTAVNGATVDLTEVSASAEDLELSGPVQLPVLPGSYTFQAPEASGVFSYGDDQMITVLPVGPDDYEGNATDVAHFEATWTEEAQQDAIQQVKDRVAGCMTSDRFEPTDCPNTLDMYDPGFGAVAGITRSWAEEPVYSFSVEDESSWYWGESSGPAVVIEGGEMTIDYQWRYDEEDDWEADSETDYDVFGYGTRVPVQANEDGTITLDFSEF